MPAINRYRIAPEIFVPGSYTRSADVFSFAVVAWEIFSQKRSNPLTGLDPYVAAGKLESGVRPEYGPEHPGMMKELIDTAWHTNPHYR